MLPWARASPAWPWRRERTARIPRTPRAGRDSHSLKRARLRVTLALVNDQGDPVPGATVAARITNTSSGRNWNRSGNTAADGKLTLTVNNSPPGCYTTQVTNVAASGLTWDNATPPNGPFCK